MKIVFIAQPGDEFPPVRGSSISIWTNELATRLASSHDVFVICGGEASDAERAHPYRIIRISTAIDGKLEQVVGSIARRLRSSDADRAGIQYRYYYFSFLYYMFYAIWAARKSAELKPNWIVFSNFSQFAPFIRRWNRTAKLFLMMHCDWLVELPYKRVKKRLGVIDKVAGCSVYIVDGIKKRFPEYAENCHTLHNASDLTRFDEARANGAELSKLESRYCVRGRKVVLFVGRVAPEKGVHILMEAMRQVRLECSDAILLVAGNLSKQPPSPRWVFSKDPEFKIHEDLKRRYPDVIDGLSRDLTGFVIMLGHVNHSELTQYYALSDLFVHPSLWNEPFGMILTEAMACGKAVVSTRAGGIPEIVQHGRTGLLVTPGSVDELAGAIVELLRNKELRESMGRRGKELVHGKFTWGNTVETMEGLMRRPLAEGKP